MLKLLSSKSKKKTSTKIQKKKSNKTKTIFEIKSIPKKKNIIIKEHY